MAQRLLVPDNMKDRPGHNAGQNGETGSSKELQTRPEKMDPSAGNVVERKAGIENQFAAGEPSKSIIKYYWRRNL